MPERIVPANRLKLYSSLASWWPLLSAPEDYKGEAAFVHKAIDAACQFKPRTMLELGSGGGNNASHLKAWYEMTLVDLSPAMLRVSRKLNPECKHIKGDMRTVRLGEIFDAVFIHDAISYMTTEDDLSAAITTAYVHCIPGGVAFFAPDHVRESFKPRIEHGGNDGGGLGVRYLEWMTDADPTDSTYTLDMAYMLRGPDGSMRVEHDRHTFGLFSRPTWLRLLRKAGFRPRAVADQWGRTVLVASKPAPARESTRLRRAA
jgi:SAM-dependent methyltransferase